MPTPIKLPEVYIKRAQANMVAEEELELVVADVSVFKLTVPTGKVWDVMVTLDIKEVTL